MTPLRTIAAIAGFFAAAGSSAAADASPDFPGQAAFRALYAELIETNTTQSEGSCTLAAERLAARLRAAGYAADEVRILIPTDRPKDGNLVAVLQGQDRNAPPILLLAHIDVVEARRADWKRDPFKLVEEDGYFFARGASDDKAMAASLADAMIRFRREGFAPRRTLKLALTCGEETPNIFNGLDWLLKTHAEAVSAGFALNEGANGRLEDGRRVYLGIQAGEKVYQDFTLEITNPGGHSSRPVRDNAIYRLAAAVSRIGAYAFPLELTPAIRLQFERMSPILGGGLGADLKAVLAQPTPADVADRIAQDPSYNAVMRTTCVVTQFNAGHAPNALPQRATANINCRILPGHPVMEIRAALAQVAADPGITVSVVGTPSPVSPPPPLTAAVTGPAEAVAHELWPGVPLVPTLLAGATDGRFLLAAGIPTYGLSGIFSNANGDGIHGLDERISVRSLYEGREFLYRVVKRYTSAGAPDAHPAAKP